MRAASCREDLFRSLLVVFSVAALSCSVPASAQVNKPSASTALKAGEQDVTWVPMLGTAHGLYTRICRPRGSEPAPLVVINHGSPFDKDRRPKMEPMPCSHATVRFFTERGYVAAQPMRRGYGKTGGNWFEGYGRCEKPNFASGGNATANDIWTAIQHLRSLPGILAHNTVVVGQSAGGWGTIALASSKAKGVTSFVNFAGGRGGRQQGRPHNNCDPEALISAAATFGRNAKYPMLWIYTQNDSFFAPNISRRMHVAFKRAGGKARFVMLPPFEADGHLLFARPGGIRIWGPIVERWLANPNAE